MISAISNEHSSRELQEELKACCEQMITFKVVILGTATGHKPNVSDHSKNIRMLPPPHPPQHHITSPTNGSNDNRKF
jgi:hypothetical protein